MASFSTYQSPLRTGLPTKDDAEWVDQLLGKFMNRQTALFMRWLEISLPSKKEQRTRLVVITPLRIILIKSKTFGRSVHRKYRIIDITSVQVTENKDNTSCVITQCDFPPELSISRSREKLKNKEFAASALTIFLPKDIDREFLDILQWSLFIVTRGLPKKFRPKIDIPKTFENEISDPVGPGQFVIDRYVAYCDAQTKNSGAGIAASESLIEYTLGSVSSGVFDVNLSFNSTKRNIDNLQFVCLSQGLSFSTVYKKLVLNQLSGADDTNIAILMTLLETNHEVETLEFRRVDVQTKTMRSLSSSLSCSNGLSKLQEINIIDISINKNMILALSTGLSYIKLAVLRLTNCYLNKTATIQLFNILQKSEQYKYLTHLNISKNQCGKQGTKAMAAFLTKTVALQVLVVADAQLDGNEFFNALTLKPNSGAQLCHLDTLTLLDFSGNNVGSTGAGYLANFMKQARSLNYCKLSRCNMGETQLRVIFGAALTNMNGFDAKVYDPQISSNMSRKRRPTHAEIMLSTNLLCLSLDLSDNAFGSKGAEIMCKQLRQRENYTIVSLNVAQNNFNVTDMKNVIYALRSMACLERLCISQNVKRGIGKKSDRDGVIGRALLYLFEQIPTLNELAIVGSEQSNCYLEIGLQDFLAATQLISNLEFLDITGNKIGDKLFTKFLNSLSNNTRLRLIRCADNKLSFEVQLAFIQLLSSHPSIIDKLPPDHPSTGKSKSSKQYKEYFALKDAAKQNLRANKQQFEIDRKMLNSLPREMRLEKELRRCCGTQYGISLERIRGTVRNPDYVSRIPFILVKLKDLLLTRGGLDTVGIFRIQPDANEFPHVKQALNTNNFEFRINDINCIANAIKVWYRDLPIKVLTPISKSVIIKCSSAKEVSQCIASLHEPYKSIFEWLMDLAVQVVENVAKNKMDAKNMAVVLCPNLYENDQQSADAMVVQQALLRFTEFAIRHRIEFRRTNPFKKINDMLALQAGLTPGIADQNALENEDDDEFKEEISISIGSDEGGADMDGFAVSNKYAGGSSRGFRGIAKSSSHDGKVSVASIRNKFEKQKKEPSSPVPPPAAYSVQSGKVKKVAANLPINVKAMLPGSKAPKRNSAKQPQPAAAAPIQQNANLGRPAGAKKRKKSKKKKGKKLLLESMVDNYDQAASVAKVPPAEGGQKEAPRRQSHHVPMESKVLGGFVQPGLAISMAVGIGVPSESDANKKHKHKKKDSESSDEMIPALAHLDGEAQDGDGGEEVLDYMHEEQTYKFETKPMGFQIEAENGKISVRSVRVMSIAGQYGVQAKWDIVAVNGFRDWSSMLGILESSLGPFTIIFAVPVVVKSMEKSLSSTNRQHPIVPSAVKDSASKPLLAPAEDAEVPAMEIPPPYIPPAAATAPSAQEQDVLRKQKSIVSVSSAVSDEDMKAEEYGAKKDRFNMMQRNSSYIAKQVLNEYDEDPALDKEVKTNRKVFASGSAVQQKEYLRLESEIKKFQTKTAQLLETLQVIRLKGEMERIELENAKKLQSENMELKKELNSKVKPLKAQIKNCNKQIQTQRQLMYQYANLLRRHKIDIPELQVSLQENESSSESDSDSSSSSDDDSSED